MEFLIPTDKKDERPTFENTTYLNQHKKKQILTIHSSSGDFNVKLTEPLRIEKFSEIYLGTLVTFGKGAEHANNVANKQYFILKIDQFNLQQKSNMQLFNNSIIIPNESSSGTGVTAHKNKKNNYVGTIQPGVITNISGTLTDYVGGAILNNHSITVTDHGAGTGDTIIITYSKGGSTKTVTLTAASATSPGTTFNDEAGTNDAVGSEIVTAWGGEGGITATNDNGTVTFSSVSGQSEILSIGGTYVADHATAYHPHFFVEFTLVEGD
jgi:hypothetical protein